MMKAVRSMAISAATACAYAQPALAEQPPSLQPYQMVRSLQLLQDRIAAGDHAALPLQNKLLELIDGRLREADDAAFEEKRNVRAALVYGMSGGNPTTLTAVFRKKSISDDDRKLGRGVLAYLQGDPGIAKAALADIDPKTLPPEVGAFLALVKGSVSSAGDPAFALKQFDDARLLGPGTLVEEAALRRSLAIEASLGRADRFYLAAKQYVHRFLRSPYASQFADSLVSGVLALHSKLDLDSLEEITSMMDADQRKVIYLRLARRAAIEGLSDLSIFASGRAESEPEKDRQDPRSQLYSSLSTLTSENNIEGVAARLKSIDRRQLSDSDIRLLDAAERVVGEMTAPPRVEPEGAVAAAPVDAATHPSAPTAKSEPETANAAAPEAPFLAAGQNIAETPPAAVAEAADPADVVVSETRARLNAIDKMLEEAK